ncbi:hypothetical protein FB545_1276 [Peribacillus frigoritolerans]|nr:hypothetical protein FB545_1276 [Peribacillus frigoritolerans]
MDYQVQFLDYQKGNNNILKFVKVLLKRIHSVWDNNSYKLIEIIYIQGLRLNFSLPKVLINIHRLRVSLLFQKV